MYDCVRVCVRVCVCVCACVCACVCSLPSHYAVGGVLDCQDIGIGGEQ